MVARKSKKAKARSKKKEYKKVLICPACGSRRIDYASLHTESGEIIGFGIPEKYYCPDCGYKGSVVLEVNEKDIKKARKEVISKRIKKHKTTARHAEVLKPVFTLIILLFFLAAITMMVPKYKIEKTPSSSIGYKMGTITETAREQPTVVKEKASPILMVNYENSTLRQVSNAIGFPTLASILFPLFMIFFTAGFFVLMIYSHGKRLEMFS